MTLRRSPPKVLLILLAAALITVGCMSWASAAPPPPTHVHEAVYSWYGAGSSATGTHAVQGIPAGAPSFDVGDTSTSVWVEVKEDVYDRHNGTWLYQYTVNTVNLGASRPDGAIDVVPGDVTYEWLTSFSVPSGGTPGTLVSSDGWDYTDTGSTWKFQAPPGVGIDGSPAQFNVVASRPYTISGGGGVDYLVSATGGLQRQWIVSDNWWVSHPQTPEPGTMLLLGCGSLGLLPLLRRRRKA